MSKVVTKEWKGEAPLWRTNQHVRKVVHACQGPTPACMGPQAGHPDGSETSPASHPIAGVRCACACVVRCRFQQVFGNSKESGGGWSTSCACRMSSAACEPHHCGSDTQATAARGTTRSQKEGRTPYQQAVALVLFVAKVSTQHTAPESAEVVKVSRVVWGEMQG